MPFVTERWLGGMLTNFSTVRKSIKKMQTLDKMSTDGTYEHMNKKERLMKDREKLKLRRLFGGIEDLNRLPAALFIIDIKREHIAVAEAQKLNIPIFGIVDTNSNPNLVDYPIPGNDDASQSIELLTRVFTDALAAGLDERRKAKEANKDEEGAESEEMQQMETN